MLALVTQGNLTKATRRAIVTLCRVEIRPLGYCPEKMVRFHNISEMIDSPRDRIKKPNHFLASAPAEESLVGVEGLCARTFVQRTLGHEILAPL